MNRVQLSYIILLFLSFSFGCNTLKYLPEEEKLYTGADITIKGSLSSYEKGRLAEELSSVLQPKPNEKILGVRLGVWARQRVNRDAALGYSKWVNKRIGEEPVLLKEVDIQYLEKLMRNRLENLGYFYSSISSAKSPGKHTGKAKFLIKTGPRLSISELIYNKSDIKLIDSLLFQYISDKKPIKAKAPFDLYRLKDIRNDISHYLKEFGYYYFNADYLLFEADSINTKTKNTVSLSLKLKDGTPKAALAQYAIGNIEVYPNHHFIRDSSSKEADTTVIDGIKFIQDELYFYPSKMYPYLLLKQGHLYNEENEKFTSRRLNSLRNYRYVSIRFNRDTTSNQETGVLNSKIYLSPLKKRSFVAEFQGTSKSNNFVGTALTVEYLNRNIFHGAETFSLKGKVGYEAQLAGRELSGLNSLETGLSAEYWVPRLVSPFDMHEKFRYSIPKTKFKVAYDLVKRVQYYSLNSFLASIGYEWNVNAFVTHSLNPISLNLINISNKTDAFEELLSDNSYLRRSFEQQFIPALNYGFQYNKLMLKEQRSRFLFLFNTEFAGNTIGLLQNLAGQRGSNKSLWGVEYAQYAKFDFDLRNYFDLTQSTQLVSRFFMGWGFPYGNSESLPYAKQFFSGGPNSLRAFRIRSVGPGNYSTTDETSTSSYFDQTGDIKFEANVEYRFPIFSYFKGAVFTDAGNIWLQNGDPDNNFEGEFNSNWMSQIAIGTGLGLRFDIQFVVIRLDVATPLRKPIASGDFDWQDSFKLGNNQWRQQNIIWNFAIGYPF